MNYLSIIAAKDAQIEQLVTQVQHLSDALALAHLEVEGLKRQLNLTFQTSSKPPSSDGLRKPKGTPAFERDKGKTPRGGKPGHRGDTLKFSDRVDEEQVHAPQPRQCACGADLSEAHVEVLPERRQVFDLPNIELRVVEHRIAQRTCPCCQQVERGVFPAHVSAPVQYGGGVHALVQLLNVELNVAVKKIGVLFCELTGQALNENTIQTSIQRAAQTGRDTWLEQIKAEVLQSEVAHADETGARVEGALHWVHTLSCATASYLFCHAKRGKEALFSQQSITQYFTGILVHDFWKTYFLLACDAHAMCLAHIIRELKALTKLDARQWSKNMEDLLWDIYKLSDKGKGALNQAELLPIQQRYLAILQQAEQEEPAQLYQGKRKLKASVGRRLLERLRAHWDDVLRFAYQTCVPFTNNLAERDVRPIKTKLKVAGSFRTKASADDYLVLKSLCSTLTKQNRSIYQTLKQLWEGAARLCSTYLNSYAFKIRV